MFFNIGYKNGIYFFYFHIDVFLQLCQKLTSLTASTGEVTVSHSYWRTLLRRFNYQTKFML